MKHHHKGLTDAQVTESRHQHGCNELTPAKRSPWWVELLKKFTDPLIVILMVAAVISFIPVLLVPGHSWIESLGIVGAVLLATIVGFVNEYKANKEFDILNQVNDITPVRVIRDGKNAQVPKNEIVVGDLVNLETGEEIPADGEILESIGLHVNQSSLTGESEPVLKSAAHHGEQEDTHAGAYGPHVVLRSTMVTEGHGLIRVTRVGDKTEIGKVAKAATEETGAASPLNQQLDGLCKAISVAGFTLAFLLFSSLIVQDVLRGQFVLDQGQWLFFTGMMLSVAILMLRIWYPVVVDLLGYCKLRLAAPALVTNKGMKPWLQCLVGGVLIFTATVVTLSLLGMIEWSPSSWLPAVAAEHLLLYFMIAITLIVVSVPEGLPMSITLSLAYSMRKMAKQNNLVRRMDACETIGAATVICSDKTGTLTLNQMTVRETLFPHGDEPLSQSSIFPLLAECLASNSTAVLTEEGEALGNVTEGALLKWLKEQGSDYAQLRHSFDLHSQLPFTTLNKFMASCGQSAVLGCPVLMVKGAPEIVLARCTSSFDAELNGEKRAEIAAAIASKQAQAMRVIGLAYKKTALLEGKSLAAECQELVWLGFFAIQDPVRPEVPAAIASCTKAGVRVIIVTGDNRETACQIGREIGLLPSEGEMHPDAVMTGDQFEALSEDQLLARLRDLRVLSRARPLDKMRLVNALQSQHEVVAVTGDGTNDAPALSHADVGLSMGITGTSVAKEASDIILLDDSFSSITKAVMWGRSLYRNIQKFIVFQLTVNVAACGIAALGPFTGVNLPLTVTQMLWVNLIMDTFAALALATEPPSEDVMNMKPRDKRAFIINAGMLNWILGFGFAFVVAMMLFINHITPDGAQPSAYAVTVLFTGFVFLQFWNLFNARVYGTNKSFLSGLFKNPSFLLISLIIVLGQYLAVEFGGDIFRTVPLSLKDWGLIALCTFPVLIIGEIVRGIARARQS